MKKGAKILNEMYNKQIVIDWHKRGIRRLEGEQKKLENKLRKMDKKEFEVKE